MSTQDEAVEAALAIAEWGSVDGDHHKMWVIDQMVRTLTGCPTVRVEKTGPNGDDWSYDALGESEEYLEWVRTFQDGEDGPETYLWDVGIAP